MKQFETPPSGYEQWKKKTAWFLSGQAISLFGSSVTQFAMIWHITLSTTSGMMLMVSTLCSFLPQTLISLFAGVWADRHDRRHLVMLADGMIALTTLLLAIVYMTGYRELWLLFLVSAVRSVGAGVQTPAVSALIAQIVPPDRLMRISGVNGTIQALTMLASPAVSGAVLGLFGLEAAFLIDVFTAAIGIVIMLRLRVPRVVRSESHKQMSALEDLKQGLGFAWQNPFLRSFLGFYAALMFLFTPAAILSPLLTARSFGEEVWRLTANEMVWSLGMVIGGIAVAGWGGFRRRLDTLVLGTALFGLFTLLLGFMGNFTGFLVVLFFTGLSAPLLNSAGMVMLQESVEIEMQGRIFGLTQIISSSVIPLGMAVFGPMADAIKIEWLLVMTGGLMVLLSGLMRANRNLRHQREV